MTDIVRFTVNSSLSLPADQYTADFVGTDLWQNASEDDRVTLRAGFFNNGQEYLVTVIENGVIDKYSITVTPRSITGQILGRDQMAKMLAAEYQVIYRNGPAPATISGDPEAAEEQNGLFYASQIAQDVIDFVNEGEASPLSLAWECPDYLIHDVFNAVGRPIDILNELVKPFCLVEARKVDVFLSGSTVFCRQRQLPMVAGTLGTFTIGDVRVKDLKATKFQTDKIGRVTLTGRLLPSQA